MCHTLGNLIQISINMGLLEKQMQEVPAFRKFVYIVWIITAVLGIIMFCHTNGIGTEKKEFMPYSAKVVSFYTEKIKRAGIYYQRIKLDNKTIMTANAFSTIINGEKTRLIDYIAVGDSIVRDTWAEISVYREGSETYTFTHNPHDFK